MLVLDTETDPDHRYLGRAIAEHLPEADYRVYADDPAPVDLGGLAGVVLTGSSASVYETEHEDWMTPLRAVIRECVEREVPLLGICFGHQLVNQALGGAVEHDRRRATLVEMTDYDGETGILAGVDPVVPVVHGDVVTELGSGMRSIARTDYDPHFASVHETAPVWTVQFHPEFRPEFRSHLSNWTEGEFEFAECNAVRTLGNFDRLGR